MPAQERTNDTILMQETFFRSGYPDACAFIYPPKNRPVTAVPGIAVRYTLAPKNIPCVGGGPIFDFARTLPPDFFSSRRFVQSVPRHALRSRPLSSVG